jgi:hypothetical protein
MARKPELILYPDCPESKTWVLDPPKDHDSFRIIVQCQKKQPTHMRRSLSSYFRVLAHAVLPLLALWIHHRRRGH